MTDTTYRTATTVPPSDSKSSTEPVKQAEKGIIYQTDIEPPLSEYETKRGKPYSVDYFDLGSFWDTGEIYSKEVDSIETYISHLVNTGELNNTVEAAKSKLKSIEKMVNADPNDRKANRVGKVAAYIEFLIKADNIKKTTAKYRMI